MTNKSKTGNTFKLLFVLALYLLPSLIGQCTKYVEIEPGSQGRCEGCREDADCKEGLYCLGFFNKKGVYKKCATTATPSCPEQMSSSTVS